MNYKKACAQGVKDYNANKRLSDCPFKPGTDEFQAWVNGWSDESDKLFLKLVKLNPKILADS